MATKREQMTFALGQVLFSISHRPLMDLFETRQPQSGMSDITVVDSDVEMTKLKREIELICQCRHALL